MILSDFLLLEQFKKFTILTKLKLIRDFMRLVPRRMRDHSGESMPDESVFTDSVCRMRMRDLGIGLR